LQTQQIDVHRNISFDVRRVLDAQYRRFIPNCLPNIVSFGQIRGIRFDLGQTGPEKLSWIEVPGEA
jgi:hypothetical protein